MSFFFWYTPKRKRRGNLLPSFVFASANFAEELRFTKVISFRQGMQTETATSAWGYILLRCVKRRGNLFAVVRQFAQANSCRRLPSPALLLSCRLHMGNGNFRMGRYYFVARKRRGNLFAVVRQFAQANSCRGTPFYESQKFPKEHANGNGNFRMGLHTSSVRETTRQLVADVRQFAQANSCRRLPSPALILSYQLHMGNGNFRMGRYYFGA